MSKCIKSDNIFKYEDVKVVRMEEKTRTKYQRIHVNDLCYGNYQRMLSSTWVNRLVKNFDEGLLGVLIVSYRNGKYYVIDGQHRLEAAKRIGIDELVCQVHLGLTYEKEASLFWKYNKDKKKLSPYDIFKAELEAKDESALNMAEILDKHGYKVRPSSGGRSETKYQILAIATLKRIYKRDGYDILDRVLRLIKETWDGHRDALRENILGGMAIFVRLYNDDFSDEDFSNKLSKTHPEIILRDGRMYADYFKNTRIAVPCAKVIWKLYNAGKKKHKLEDKFIGNYR